MDSLFLQSQTEMRKYVNHSIKGINHSKNEDDLLMIEQKNYQLFFVFDGVSSAKNSKAAIRLSREFISSNYQHYFHNSEYSFIDLMYDVNKSIVNSGISEALTTYCSIFILNQKNEIAKISNLGDSRIYWMTKQYIEKLSIDDNLYPGSNVINKCLGIDSLRKSNFREEMVSAVGKRFLLCTDGFYKFLENDKMSFFNILNDSKLKSIKDKLQKEISDRNKDDATYILIV